MGQGHTHLEDECTDSEEEKFYNSELEESESECEEDTCSKRGTMEARTRHATAARLRSVWDEAKKNSSDSASEYEEAEEDGALQPPLAERSSPLGASHSDGNASLRGPELTDAEDEQGCTETCRYQQAYFFGSNTSLDSSISQPSCASLDSRLAQISGSSNTYHSRVLPRNFFLDLEREGRGCASASATPLMSPQSPSETRRRWDKSVWPEVERGLRRNQSVPDIDPSRSEDRRHRARGRSPSPKRYSCDDREKRQKIIDAVTRRLYPGSGPGFGRRTKKASEKPQVLGERECRCRKKPGSDGDIAASKSSVAASSCDSLTPNTLRKVSLPTSATTPAWRRSSLESPPGSFLPVPVRDHSQTEKVSTSPQKESAIPTLTRSSRVTRREVKTVTTTVTKTLNTTERKVVTNVQKDQSKPDMQDQAVDCDLLDRDSCEKVSCESKGAQADMQDVEDQENQEETSESHSLKKCVHPDPDLLTGVKKDESAEKEGRRKIPLTPALHQLRQALASLNDSERFSDDSLELGNLDADLPSPASRLSPRVPEDDEMSLGDISKDSLEDSVNIDVESRKLQIAQDAAAVQRMAAACDVPSAMPGPRAPKLSKKHDSFIQSFFRSISASDIKDSFEIEEESASVTDDNSETLCLSPTSAQTLTSRPSVPVKSNAVTPPPSSSSSRNVRRWTRERVEKRLAESTSSEESDVDSRQRPRFRKRRVRRMSLPLPSVPTMDLCEEQDVSDCSEGATLKLSSHEKVDSAVCANVKDINANKMLTRTQSKELLDRNRRFTSESVGECGVEKVSEDIPSTEQKQELLQFKQKCKNEIPEPSQPSNLGSSVVECLSPEYYSPRLQDPVISVPFQAGSSLHLSESDSFSDKDVETQTLLKESARKLLRTVSKEGPLSEASQDAVAELLKASSKRLAKYALCMPEDSSEMGSATHSRCESVATQDEDYDTARGEDSWLESSSEFQSALKKNGVSYSHSYASSTTVPSRELLNKDEKKHSLEGQGNLLDVVQSSSGGDVSPCAFVADTTDYSTTATTPLASSASEGFSTEGSWEDLDILDPSSKGDVSLSEKQYQVIAAEFTPRTARRLLYTIIECSESSRSESVPSEPDVIPSDWQETMSESEGENVSGCVSPEISEDLLSSSDDTMLDTVRRNVEDPQDSLSCISDDILGDSKAHKAEGYPAESFHELPWNAAGSLELLTSLPITPDCLDEEDNTWETDTKGMNYQDESNQETCATSDSGMVCTKSSDLRSVIQYGQNREEDILPEFVPYLDLSEVAGSPVRGHVVNKTDNLVSSQDEFTAVERHIDIASVNFNDATDSKIMLDKMGKLSSEISSAFERTLLDTSKGLSGEMSKCTNKEETGVGENSKLGVLMQGHVKSGIPDRGNWHIAEESESNLYRIPQTICTSEGKNLISQTVTCSVPTLTTPVVVESPWQNVGSDVTHSPNREDYLVPAMTESSQDSDMEFDSLEQIQVTHRDVKLPQCVSSTPQSAISEGDQTEYSPFYESTSIAAAAQILAASSIENTCQMPMYAREVKQVTVGSGQMQSRYSKQVPPLTPQNSFIQVSISEASSLMLGSQSGRSVGSRGAAPLTPQNSLIDVSIAEAASSLATKDADVEAKSLHSSPEPTEAATSGSDSTASEQCSVKEVKRAPPLTPQNSVMEVSISEASSVLLANETCKSKTVQHSPLTPQNSVVDISISEAASYAVQDAECMSEELMSLAHQDVAEINIFEASPSALKDDYLKLNTPKQVLPLTPQHSMVDVSKTEAASSIMLKNYEYVLSQNTPASPTVRSEASSGNGMESNTAKSKSFHKVPPLTPQNSIVDVSISEAATSLILEDKEHALNLNTQTQTRVNSEASSVTRESDTGKLRTFHSVPPLTPQNSVVEVSISEASSLLLENENRKPTHVRVCPLTPQNSMIDTSISEATNLLLKHAKADPEQTVSSLAEEATIDTLDETSKNLLANDDVKFSKTAIPLLMPENLMSPEAFESSSLEKDCLEKMTLLSAQSSLLKDSFTKEDSWGPESEVREIKVFNQAKALTPQNSLMEVSISEASSLALVNVSLDSRTSKPEALLSAQSFALEDRFEEGSSWVPEKEVREIKISNQAKALTPQNSLVEISISEASSLANVSLNSITSKQRPLLSSKNSVIEDSFAEVGSWVPGKEAKEIKVFNLAKALTPQNSLVEVSISEASSLALENTSLSSKTSKQGTLLSAQSSILEDRFAEAGPVILDREAKEIKVSSLTKTLTPQNSLMEVSISEATSLAFENVNYNSRTRTQIPPLTPQNSMIDISIMEAGVLASERKGNIESKSKQMPPLTPQNSVSDISIGEAASFVVEAGKCRSRARVLPPLTPQNTVSEVSVSEASSLVLEETKGVNKSSIQEVTTKEAPTGLLEVEGAKSKSQKHLTPLTPQNSVVEVSIAEASSMILEDEALEPHLKRVLPLQLSEGNVMLLEMESPRAIPPLTPQNSVMEVSIFDAASSVVDNSLTSECPVSLLHERKTVESALEEASNKGRDAKEILPSGRPVMREYCSELQRDISLEQVSSTDLCIPGSTSLMLQPITRLSGAFGSISQIASSDNSVEVAFSVPQVLEVGVYQEATSFVPQRSSFVTPLTPQNSVADFETYQDLAVVPHASASVACTPLNPAALVRKLGEERKTQHSVVTPITEDRLHHILQGETEIVMPQMATEEFQALTHAAQMPTERANIIQAATPATQKTPCSDPLRPEFIQTSSAQADIQEIPDRTFSGQTLDSEQLTVTDPLAVSHTSPQVFTEESQALHPRTPAGMQSAVGVLSATPQEPSSSLSHPLPQMVTKNNQVVNIALASHLDTDYHTTTPLSAQIMDEDQKMIQHSSKMIMEGTASDQVTAHQTQQTFTKQVSSAQAVTSELDFKELHTVSQLPLHMTTSAQVVTQKPAVVLEGATSNITGVADETQQLLMERPGDVSAVISGGTISSEFNMVESCSVMPTWPYVTGNVQAVISQIPPDAIEEIKSTQTVTYQTPSVSKAVNSNLQTHDLNVLPLSPHVMSSVGAVPFPAVREVSVSADHQAQPMEEISSVHTVTAKRDNATTQQVALQTPSQVMEEVSCLQAVTVHTSKKAMEKDSSDQKMMIQTSQITMEKIGIAGDVIPITSQLAMGEVRTLQAVTHETSPFTMEVASSVQVEPRLTPALAAEKAGSAQVTVPQTQHVALEEHSSDQATIFLPVTSTLSVEGSHSVTPLLPHAPGRVQVTSHLEVSSSAKAMPHHTAHVDMVETNSDQTGTHKTPLIAMRRSAQEITEQTQVDVEGVTTAQAITQPQMSLEKGVSGQTIIHQAVPSNLDIEESHLVIPLLPQKANAFRAKVHQTSHISKEGTLQAPQMAMEASLDQAVTLQTPQMAMEASLDQAVTLQTPQMAKEPSGVQMVTHKEPQMAKETISGQSANLQELQLALETGTGQTVPLQTQKILMKEGSGSAVLDQTPLIAMEVSQESEEASSGQAVTYQGPEASRAVPLTLLTSQLAMETNSVEAVTPLMSTEKGLSVRTVDMVEKQASSVQEGKYQHLTMGVANSAQAVTPQASQVAMQKVSSAQSMNQHTSEIIMEQASTQAVIQQAVTSQLGLEEIHSVMPLLPQETDCMQAVIHETPRLDNQGASSTQAVALQKSQIAMISSDQAVTLQTLQTSVGKGDSTQTVPFQTSQMDMGEASSAPTVTVQIPTMAKEGISSTEAVTVQRPQRIMEGTCSAQAVPLQAPQVAMREASSAQTVIQQAVTSHQGSEETHSVIPLLPQDTSGLRTVIHQTPQLAREGMSSVQALQTPQMAMGETSSAQAVTLQTPQMAMGEANSAHAVTLQTPQMAMGETNSAQAVTLQTPQMAMGEANSAHAVTLQIPQMAMGETNSAQAVTLQTPQIAMGETSSAQSVTLQTPQMAMGEANSAHAVTLQTPQMAIGETNSAQAVTLQTPQMAMGEVGSAQAVTLQTLQTIMGEASSAQAVTPQTPQTIKGEANSAQAVTLQTPQMAMGEANSAHTVTLQTPQMAIGETNSAQAVTLQTPQMAMGEVGSAQAVTPQTPQIVMGETSSAQAVTRQTPQMAMGEANSAHAVTLQTPQMAMGEASSAQAVTLQTPQMAMGEANSAQAVTLQTPQMAMGEANSAHAVTLQTPQMAMGEASSAQAVTLQATHMGIGGTQTEAPLLPERVIREASSAQAVIQHAVTSQLSLEEGPSRIPLLPQAASKGRAVITVQTPHMGMEGPSSAQAMPIQTPQMAKREFSSAQAVTIQTPQIPMEETDSAVTLQTPEMAMGETSSAQVGVRQAVTSHLNLEETHSVIPLLPQDTSNLRTVIHQTPQMDKEGASSAQAVTVQTPAVAMEGTSSAQIAVHQAVTSQLGLEESHSVISLLPQDTISLGTVIHQTPGISSVQTPQMDIEGISSAQAVTVHTQQMTKGDASSTQMVIQQAVTSQLGMEESHSVISLLPQDTGSIRTVIHQIPQVAKERMSSDQEVAPQTAMENASSAQAGIQQPVTSQLCLEETHSVISLLSQDTSCSRAVTRQTPQMVIEGHSSAQAVTVKTPQMSMRETNSAQAVTHQMTMGETGREVVTPDMAIRETNSAQMVIKQAVSSQLSSEETYSVTQLSPEDTSDIQAVIHHTPQVAIADATSTQVIEGRMSSAQAVTAQTPQMVIADESDTQAVIQQAVTSVLDLEELHSVTQVLPKADGSVRTVIHQTPQGRTSSDQAVTLQTPQMAMDEAVTAQGVIRQAVTSQLGFEESHAVISLLPQDNSSTQTVTVQTPQMAIGDANRAIIRQSVTSQLDFEETVTQLLPQVASGMQAVIHQAPQVANKRMDSSAQAVTIQTPQMAMVGVSSAPVTTGKLSSAQAVTIQTAQMPIADASNTQAEILQAVTSQLDLEETCSVIPQDLTSVRAVIHQIPQEGTSSDQSVTLPKPQMAIEGAESGQAMTSQLGLDETHSVNTVPPQDTGRRILVIHQAPQEAKEDMRIDQTVTRQTPQTALREATSSQAVTLPVTQMATEESSSAKERVQQAVTSQLLLEETHSVVSLLPQDTNSLRAVLHHTPQVVKEGMSIGQAAAVKKVAIGETISAQAVTLQTSQMAMGEASSAQAVTLQTPQTVMGEAGSAHAVTLQTPQWAMREASSDQAVTLQTPRMAMGEASSAHAVTLQTPQMAMGEAGSAQAVTRQTPQTVMGEASSAQAVTLQTPQMAMGEASSAQAVTLQTPQMAMGEASSAQAVTLLTPQWAMGEASSAQAVTPQTLQTIMGEANSAQAVTLQTPQMAMGEASSAQAVTLQTPQMAMGEASSAQAVTLQTPQWAMGEASSAQAVTPQTLQTIMGEANSAHAVTLKTPQMAMGETSSAQAVTLQPPQMTMGEANITQTVTFMEKANSIQAVTVERPQVTMVADRTQAVIQQAITSEIDVEESYSVISLLPQETSNIHTVIHHPSHLAKGGTSSLQAVTQQTQMCMETGSSALADQQKLQKIREASSAQTVPRQAVITELEFESLSVTSLVPQKTSHVRGGAHHTSHADKGSTRYGQSETLQASSVSLEEVSNKQSVTLHAMTSKLNLEEAQLGISPLLQKPCNVLSVPSRVTGKAVDGLSSAEVGTSQTSEMNMEGSSSAEPLIKQAGVSELNLETLRSLTSLSPQIVSNVQVISHVTPQSGGGSAPTVSHRPHEEAVKAATALISGQQTEIPPTEQRIKNVQTGTYLPAQTAKEGGISDRDESRSGFAVAQAVACELDADESHSVASLLPLASGGVKVVTRQTPRRATEETGASLPLQYSPSLQVSSSVQEKDNMDYSGTVQTTKESPLVASQLPLATSNIQEMPCTIMEVTDSAQGGVSQASAALGWETAQLASNTQDVTDRVSLTIEANTAKDIPRLVQTISFDNEQYNTMAVNPRASLKPLSFADGEDPTPLAASTPINPQTPVTMGKEQSSLEDSAYATATPTDWEKFSKETSVFVPELEPRSVAIPDRTISELECMEQEVSPVQMSHGTSQMAHGKLSQTLSAKLVSGTDKKSMEGDSSSATGSDSYEGVETISSSNIIEEKIYPSNREMLENKPEPKCSASALNVPPRKNRKDEIVVTSEEEFFSAEDTALASSPDSVTSLTSQMLSHDDKNMNNSQKIHLDLQSDVAELDKQTEKISTASKSSSTENLPSATAYSAKGSVSIRNDNSPRKKGHAGNILGSCDEDPRVVVSSCSVPRVTLEQEVSEESCKGKERKKEEKKQAEGGEAAKREGRRSKSVDQGRKSALPGNIRLPHGKEGQPIASTNVIGQSALAGFGRSTKGPNSSSVTEECLAREGNIVQLQDTDSAICSSANSETHLIPIKTKLQDSSTVSKKDNTRSEEKMLRKVAKEHMEALEEVTFHQASETNYRVTKAENVKLIETRNLPRVGNNRAPDTEIKPETNKNIISLKEDKTSAFEENTTVATSVTKHSQGKETRKNVPVEKKRDPQGGSGQVTSLKGPAEVTQTLQKKSAGETQHKFIRQATHPPVVTSYSNIIMQPQEACEQTDDRMLESQCKTIYKAEEQKPEYAANYNSAKLKRSLYSRKLAGQVFNQMTYPTYEPEREEVQVEDLSTLKKNDSTREVPAHVGQNAQGKLDSKSKRHDNIQTYFQTGESDDKKTESKTTDLSKNSSAGSLAFVSSGERSAGQEHQTKNYGKTMNENDLDSKIAKFESTDEGVRSIRHDNLRKISTPQEQPCGIAVTVSNYSSTSPITSLEDEQMYVVAGKTDAPKLKLTSESWRGQFLMEHDPSDEWGASDESITFIFMNPDEERPSEENLLQANVNQSNGSNYRSSSDLSHVGLSFDTASETKQTHFFDLYKARCGRLVRSTSLDSVYWNLRKLQTAKQKTEMQRTSSLEEVVTQELEDILARGRRFSSAESEEEDVTEDASTVRQNRCHIPAKSHSDQTDSREFPEASDKIAMDTEADDQAINTSSSGDDDVFAKSPSPVQTYGQINWCDFKGMILGRPINPATIRVMSGESSKSSPQLHCRQTPEKLNKKSVSWTDLQGCGALEMEEVPEIRSQESAKLVLPPKSIMKKPSLAPIASTPPPQTPPSPISPRSPSAELPSETTHALRTIRRAAVNSSSESDDIPLPRSKLKEMFSLQLPQHIRDRVTKTGAEGLRGAEEPEPNANEMQSTFAEDAEYSKVRQQFKQASRPPSLALSKKSSNSPSLNDSQSSGVSLSFGKSLSTDDNSVSGFSQYSDLFTSSNISLASGFSPSGPTPSGVSSAGFPSSCVVSSQQVSSLSTAVSASEGPLSRGVLQPLDSNFEAQDPNSVTNSPATRMISRRHFGSSFCSSPSDDTASVVSTSPINIMSAPTTPATETAPSAMSSHKNQPLSRCRSEGDIALHNAEGFSHTWVALSQVMKEAGTILKTLSETSLVLHHQIANPNQRVALAPVAEEANGTTSPAGAPDCKRVNSVGVQTDQHQPSNVKMRSIVAQTSFESSSEAENLDAGGRTPSSHNYRSNVRSTRRFDLPGSHASSIGSGMRGKTFSQEINNLRHERERINRILGHYDSSSLHYSRSGSRYSNKSSSSELDSPMSSLRASLQNLPHTTLERDLESDGSVGSNRHRLSATSQKYISLHQRRLEESCRLLEERLKLSARKRHLRSQILDNGHSHHHRHAAKVAYHSSLDFAKTPFCERLESPNTTPYLSTTSLPTAGPHSPVHSRELSPCCCVSPIHQPQHNHCRPSAHTCSTHSHWSSCHSTAAPDSAYTPHYMNSKIRTSTQKCKEQLLCLRRHLVGASGLASSSSSLGDSPSGRNRYRFGNLNHSNYDGPYQRGHAASLSSLPGVNTTPGAWRRRVGGSVLSVASETEAYRRRPRYRQDSDSDSGAGWSCSGTSLRHSYQ